MRVMVRIPEPDIPYVQRGDVATIHFDALPDREFKAPISRIADEEEAQTRTMLAEIDLPNPDELIHDHMFGRVDIELDSAPEGVTIPSACLAGHVVDSRARVFIVRDGRAQARDVEIGRDTGVSVEILSGIGVDDEVVFRPAGSLADGTEVICKPAANTNLTDEARQLPR
jgi:multidrug efflux pump subunit AcrA (membrane-fusion protein)